MKGFYFNWLDIVFLVILVRVIYTAVKNGFVVEMFKLISTLIGLFFSFHFYSTGSGFLAKVLPFPIPLTELLVFSLIFFSVWAVFRILRMILFYLFKIEPHSVIERWVSVIISLIRGTVFVSLLFFLMNIPASGYLKNASQMALSFKLVKDMAPTAYGLLFKFYKLVDKDAKLNTDWESVYENKGNA